jgi:hypothetical protein
MSTVIAAVVQQMDSQSEQNKELPIFLAVLRNTVHFVMSGYIVCHELSATCSSALLGRFRKIKLCDVLLKRIRLNNSDFEIVSPVY